MKRRMRWIVLFLVPLAAMVSSQAQVTVYHVPKEKSAVVAEPPPAVAATVKPLEWATPAGWKELAGDSMRLATFAVTGAEGKQAQASIIPIGGKGGMMSDNVNRWRGQLGLTPLEPSAMGNQISDVDVGAGKGQLFEAVGTLQGHPTRMIVAILLHDDTAWFFKFVGDDSLVAAQKPTFEQFLKSISFNEGVVGADAAPQPLSPAANFATIHQGMNLGGADIASRAPETGNHPAWKVPANWQQVAASPMLVSKFQVSDSASARAEINVSTGPVSAGGAAANINRWRAQLGLAAMDQPGLAKLITPVDVASAKAMLVDLSGQDPESGDAKRLVALIVPLEGQTWFFKLMGNANVVGKEKSALIAFAQSTRFTDAH